MDSKKITLIRDLKLDRDDYMIKVRIIRMWKLTNFANRNNVYEIDMILMDEEGGKIQCNVEAPFIQRLGKLLEEYAAVYIEKPTIGLNVGSYRNVENQHKLYFYYTTKVSRCNDFNGPVHGFSFATFQSLMENSIPKDVTFDIIGEVVNLFTDSSNNPTQQKKQKINLEVQDLQGNRVFVTLWQDYAKQMMDYVNANPDQTTLSIILQFGRLNFYMGRPYVNNSFRSSKLFINENIDEILAFKRSLIEKSGDQSSSSNRTISSSIVYSLQNEFLSKNTFYKISAIHGLDEGSSAIVLGTIKVIEQEQPWFYIACSNCRRKVQVVKATNDESGDVSQNVESEVFWCSNPMPECQNNVISAAPRFIVRVRVQGVVGVVTLTLFDREVREMLNISAASLVEKYKKAGLENEYPIEFENLLEKKYAFKVIVGKFNSTKNVRYYNVSKLTDAVDIISELDMMEKKLANEQEVESESESVKVSEETVNLKDDTSFTGDNSTPTSNTVSNGCNTPAPKVKTNKSIPVAKELKRNLNEVYDVDAPACESGTKRAKTIAESKSDAPVKLLIPKIEK